MAELVISVGGATAAPPWLVLSFSDASGAPAVVDRWVANDGSGSYPVQVDAPDGSYTLSVTRVPDGFAAPTSTPIVRLDSGRPAAVSLALPNATPQTDDTDAQTDGDGDETTAEPWLTPALAAAATTAAAFWVVVLALPERADRGIPGETLTGFLVIGVAMLAFGLYLLFRKSAHTSGVMLAIAGATVIGLGIALTAKVDIDPERRLGIGVGGLAVATLIVGIQRFRTIRAAVALPITVLFIGIVTYPAAEDLIDEGLRTEITRWIGVILGATAIAEGITQAATATAQGKAAAAAASSGATPIAIEPPPGDLGTPGD